MRHDVSRGYHWYLLAHGGAYTPAHHDANGLATWVEIKHGGKCWILIRPEPTVDRHEAVKIFADIVQNPMDQRFTTSKARIRSIILRPGSLL